MRVTSLSVKEAMLFPGSKSVSFGGTHYKGNPWTGYYQPIGNNPPLYFRTEKDRREYMHRAGMEANGQSPVAKLRHGEAADRLACSSCVLVNLGLKRNDFASTHISYFYDLDLVFPRVSYPHLMSAGNAPPGCGSIQVEIYFSKKYRPFTGAPADYIEPAIRDLVRCGVLREDDSILVRQAVHVRHANVIFDHDRAPAVALCHGFLDELGIASPQSGDERLLVGWCGGYDRRRPAP